MEERLIILLGDIHGEFMEINRFFKRTELKGVDLIQVGDFGVGFFYNDPRNIKKEARRLKNLNDYLGKRDSQLYVVRGNHDNPKFFDGTHTEYENITFLPDYTVFELNGIKILNINGAISIDRGSTPYEDNKIGRFQGVSWWEDEVVKYTEENKAKILKTKGIDMIISHNAPDFAQPYGIGKILPRFAENDKTLLDDVRTERNLLSKIWDDINENSHPRYWFYGHFHQPLTTEYDYQCTMVCLDIDEFHEFKLKE